MEMLVAPLLDRLQPVSWAGEARLQFYPSADTPETSFRPINIFRDFTCSILALIYGLRMDCNRGYIEDEIVTKLRDMGLPLRLAGSLILFEKRSDLPVQLVKHHGG